VTADLPRDLVAEVEAELDAGLVELRLTADRISALAELRGLAVAEAARLRHPVTAADLLYVARDETARSRLLLLLRRLRGDPGRY
jgi:hypothetical protein